MRHVQLTRVSGRTGLAFLTFGTLLTGCADEPAQVQSIERKGVTTVLKETAPGSWVIEDEAINDAGTNRLVMMHADGRVETVADSARFRELLPAEPPARADSWAPAPARSGFGLGDVLLFTMLMDLWRPRSYAYFSPPPPPPSAYRDAGVYRRVQNQVRPTFQAYRQRGAFAPASGARPAAGTRATRPSAPRGGFFSGGSRGAGS